MCMCMHVHVHVRVHIRVHALVHLIHEWSEARRAFTPRLRRSVSHTRLARWLSCAERTAGTTSSKCAPG